MNFFPTKILLATDGSKEAELAAQTAVNIVDKTHSELHVVHVGEFLSTFFAHTEEEPIELQRGAQRLLDEEAAKIQEAMKGRISDTHLRLGRDDEQIIALTDELEVGLIVMGSRGLGGVRRALMGSVSDSVVRHAYCPVLVVRKEQERQMSTLPTRILLAIDGSEEAELALRAATDLAKSTNSELHVTYVCPMEVGIPSPHPLVTSEEAIQRELEQAMGQAQEFLDKWVERIKDEGVAEVKSHLKRGRPDEEIVTLADELSAGLIVLGSRGLGGMKRALMGSVSDSVVRHASCPVLVVRKGLKPDQSGSITSRAEGEFRKGVGFPR